MPLLQVFRDPADTDGSLNTAVLRNALLLANDGIELEPGNWNVRALGGRVVPMPVNKTIAGAPVPAGADPVTTLTLVGSDGSGGTVIGLAVNGQCRGIVVRDLAIDGGRALGGWGTQNGACISLAGHNDYASTHSVLLENLRLWNGLTQQTSFNSVHTFTWTGVRAWATTTPTVSSHGCDFDAVANEKPTTNGLIANCDLDSWGQECIKFENCSQIVVDSTVLRMYVSVVQDNVDVYSSVGAITFRRCTIDAAVTMGLVKRRRIPGSTFVNLFPSGKTCTLSGTNAVGGTLVSPGSGGGSGEYQFLAAHVGKMVGFYSGQGRGAAIIDSVDTATGAITSATVVDVFSSLTLPVWSGTGTRKWVIAATDNAGDGTLTFDRCTFTASGLIWPQDGNPANYGVQTIVDNAFDPAGNSFVYPAGTPLVSANNLFAGLPVKRFARPNANAKYGIFGGTGIAGLSQGMARANATPFINIAIGYALPGDEVWVQDGRYAATTGGNRSLNCGGKAITVRAESALGVVIDLSAGSGWRGFSSDADPPGSLIWGFWCVNAGQGGNGNGFSVVGGSVTLRKVKVSNCTTNNSGPGIRVYAGSTPVIEDYEVEDCAALGTSTGGGVYCASAAAIFRRGRIVRCSSAGVGGGVRIDSNSGAVFEGLECVGCTATSGAGFAAGRSCTLTNYSAAGNVASAAGHDLWVADTYTLTGDSLICWSANAAVKPVSNGASGVLVLDRFTVRGGASAAQFGNAGGANAWTNASSADPLFVDPAGGNLQLSDTSPVKAAGVLRSGRWDLFNTPFVQPAQGAWA
jgi:hypothetical protein